MNSNAGCLPEPTQAERILISKVIRIPAKFWNFDRLSTMEHKFVFSSQELFYEILVSGGSAYQLKVRNAGDGSILLALQPTDELRAFTNELIELRQKQLDLEMQKIIYRVDSDLTKIIESV